MDPHCGWCYANGSNIEYVYKTFKNYLAFEVMAGGMWLNDRAPVGGNELKTFIDEHAPQLIEKTGAILSDDYLALVKNPEYTFSSLEPSAAMQAVKTMAPHKTLAFSKLVQASIYIEGKRLDKLETYLPILAMLQLDRKTFEATWMSTENKVKTLAEMDYVQGFSTGFPALILKQNEKYYRIASGYFEGVTVVNGLTEFLAQQIL